MGRRGEHHLGHLPHRGGGSRQTDVWLNQPEGDVRLLPSPSPTVLHVTPGRVAASTSAHRRGQPVGSECF